MKTGIYERYLLFAFLLASILPYSFVQSCTPSMNNTVVYEGDSASFTSNEAVQWTVAPSSSTFSSLNVIYPNPDTTVDPKYSASYQVTATQLTILDATSAAKGTNTDSTAGVYLMSNDGGNTYCSGAGLTVIMSGPNCSYDDTDPDDVKLTCSVKFANYINQRIVPIMTWTSNGATVTSDTPQPASLDENNPGIQYSISNLPISSNDTSSYGCTMTFSTPSPDQPENISDSAPVFTAVCNASYPVKTTTPPPTTTAAPTTAAPTTAAPTTAAPTTAAPTTAAPTTTAATTTATTTTTTTTPTTTTTTTPTTTITTPTTTTTTTTLTTTTTALPSSPTSTASSVASASTPSAQSPVTDVSGQTQGPVSASTTTAPVQFPPSEKPDLKTTAKPTATGDGSSDGQALAIVLSLVLGSLLVSGVVCGCWWCCCCPYAADVEGTEGKQQRPTRRVRRVRRIMYFWRRVPVEVAYNEEI